MNNLKELLKRENMTVTELAGLIGKRVPVVWRWTENKFDPSLKHAFLIEERTKRRIKVRELLTLERTP